MAEGVDKPIDMNGSYRHKVDAKGRMSLPAAFREHFGRSGGNPQPR